MHLHEAAGGALAHDHPEAGRLQCRIGAACSCRRGRGGRGGGFHGRRGSIGPAWRPRCQANDCLGPGPKGRRGAFRRGEEHFGGHCRCCAEPAARSALQQCKNRGCPRHRPEQCKNKVPEAPATAMENRVPEAPAIAMETQGARGTSHCNGKTGCPRHRPLNGNTRCPRHYATHCARGTGRSSNANTEGNKHIIECAACNDRND